MYKFVLIFCIIIYILCINDGIKKQKGGESFKYFMKENWLYVIIGLIIIGLLVWLLVWIFGKKQKYSCSGAKCIKDDNGSFENDKCDNICVEQEKERKRKEEKEALLRKEEINEKVDKKLQEIEIEENELYCENNDNPCINGGRCVSLGPDTFECRCSGDFYGDLCQLVIPRDMPRRLSCGDVFDDSDCRDNNVIEKDRLCNLSGCTKRYCCHIP